MLPKACVWSECKLDDKAPNPRADSEGCGIFDSQAAVRAQQDGWKRKTKNEPRWPTGDEVKNGEVETCCLIIRIINENKYLNSSVVFQYYVILHFVVLLISASDV